jgi:hypothetical protein
MKKFAALMPFMFVIAFALQAFLSCTRSTDGDALSKIQQQTSLISTQNQNLETEILTLTSLDSIQNFATNMSMKPAVVVNLTAITVVSLAK